MTHYQQHTTLIALLQPAPDTFELFDDVLLLSEGPGFLHKNKETCIGFQQSNLKSALECFRYLSSLALPLGAGFHLLNWL